MVDILALAVSHGLLLLACWRLLSRPDLDADGADAGAPPARRPGPAPMRVNRDVAAGPSGDGDA